MLLETHIMFRRTCYIIGKTCYISYLMTLLIQVGGKIINGKFINKLIIQDGGKSIAGPYSCH